MMKQSFTISMLAGIAACSLILQLDICEATITCSEVNGDLMPCVRFLVCDSGSPSSACCSGIESLEAAASTTEDRRKACSCIISAAKMIKIKDGAANDLAKDCGVQLPIPITPSVDCSTIP